MKTKTEVVSQPLKGARRWNLAAEGSVIDQMQSHPGSFLKRQHKGKTHVVYYLGDNQYTYEGQRYSSLSAVASLITGYNISGNKFFTPEKTDLSIV